MRSSTGHDNGYVHCWQPINKVTALLHIKYNSSPAYSVVCAEGSSLLCVCLLCIYYIRFDNCYYDRRVVSFIHRSSPIMSGSVIVLRYAVCCTAPGTKSQVTMTSDSVSLSTNKRNDTSTGTLW